jgi:hypothetical protein
MPEIDFALLDPAALIALGFLGSILVLSAGLFVWLAGHMGKRGRTNSG